MRISEGATDQRREVLVKAFYAGRNDHWNSDQRRTYADREEQAWYDEGRSLAAADDALDADTEWDRD